MKSRMDHVQVNGQWEAEDDQTFNDGLCDASIKENRCASTGISLDLCSHSFLWLLT